MPLADDRVRAERERAHETFLGCAWSVLCRARDAGDALLILAVLCPEGEDAESALRELRARRPRRRPPWTTERVKARVLEFARSSGRPFSANRFYVDLPPEARPLIGPALQSLRHRHFETLGTEIAISPARKMSRVTVYRLREEQ